MVSLASLGKRSIFGNVPSVVFLPLSIKHLFTPGEERRYHDCHSFVRQHLFPPKEQMLLGPSGILWARPNDRQLEKLNPVEDHSHPRFAREESLFVLCLLTMRRDASPGGGKR